VDEDEPRPDVRTELLLGIEVGFNEGGDTPSADEEISGTTITRPSSWWAFRRCHTCGHTFRPGDRVTVDHASRDVRHLVPGLECGTAGETAEYRGAADRDELHRGLITTWPAPVPISQLAREDWRIPQAAGNHSAGCLYCGHSFRPGEWVVICPCQAALGKPPACGAALHRDPVIGLPCWDRWPHGELTVCPVSAARL
jgi:hypothetical protein